MFLFLTASAPTLTQLLLIVFLCQIVMFFIFHVTSAVFDCVRAMPLLLVVLNFMSSLLQRCYVTCTSGHHLKRTSSSKELLIRWWESGRKNSLPRFDSEKSWNSPGERMYRNEALPSRRSNTDGPRIRTPLKGTCWKTKEVFYCWYALIKPSTKRKRVKKRKNDQKVEEEGGEK